MPAIPATDPALAAALQLVMQIEARLAYGRPIVDRHGRRLHDLEDVVRAILSDSLAPLPPSGGGAGGGGQDQAIVRTQTGAG